MFDSGFWYALRLNLQGNLQSFWREWGGDLAELATAVAIAALVYILVTPEKFAPDHRAENRQVRRENRRVAKAVTRIQSRYRGNKARGLYEKAKATSAGADE
jgi:hypothetical protein